MIRPQHLKVDHLVPTQTTTLLAALCRISSCFVFYTYWYEYQFIRTSLTSLNASSDSVLLSFRLFYWFELSLLSRMSPNHFVYPRVLLFPFRICCLFVSSFLWNFSGLHCSRAMILEYSFTTVQLVMIRWLWGWRTHREVALKCPPSIYAFVATFIPFGFSLFSNTIYKVIAKPNTTETSFFLYFYLLYYYMLPALELKCSNCIYMCVYIFMHIYHFATSYMLCPHWLDSFRHSRIARQ